MTDRVTRETVNRHRETLETLAESELDLQLVEEASELLADVDGGDSA